MSTTGFSRPPQPTTNAIMRRRPGLDLVCDTEQAGGVGR
jgi:hypothetical protein